MADAPTDDYTSLVTPDLHFTFYILPSEHRELQVPCSLINGQSWQEHKTASLLISPFSSDGTESTLLLLDGLVH